MMRILNMLILGGLAIWAASFFLNGSASDANTTILTMEERHAFAEEACAAAWQAMPGFGPVTSRHAEAREDYDEVYACTGVAPRAGEVLLVARYAGGPRRDAVSYRIDALCDAAGNSLLEGGGRMPEACAAAEA
ncbi:hypothetical protein [Hyphobacterium sp.]|uniref:hypothetical protein n=1 Tax=Hyphobacterium sp. TaxID=2004662 RepID=UPI003BA88408